MNRTEKEKLRDKVFNSLYVGKEARIGRIYKHEEYRGKSFTITSFNRSLVYGTIDGQDIQVGLLSLDYKENYSAGGDF